MKYEDLEKDFINRTYEIIQQYNAFEISKEKKFETTLLINCLLGLIILPKEKLLQKIENAKIADVIIFNKDVFVNEDIKSMRDLIFNLRHAIAHFDISATSDNDRDINLLTFKNIKKDPNYIVLKIDIDNMYKLVTYIKDNL